MAYNWTYTSGYTDARGNIVPVSANNVRPTGWAYVDTALGDDTTGDGSRDLPYKTIAKGNTIVGNNGVVVIAEGTYAETTTPGNNSKIIGDGSVIIDAALFYGGTPNCSLYNLRFIQGSVTNTVAPVCYDCVFLNANPITLGTSYIGSITKGCTFINTQLNFAFSDEYVADLQNHISNNTFYGCNVIFRTVITTKIAVAYNIFSNCNINFTSQAKYVDYCIFWQCNFRFGSASASATLYPSVPATYSYLSIIETIRTANTSAFGSNASNLNQCRVVDPLFINTATNDYHLSPNSPARFTSYYGTYWGGNSVTYPVGFNASHRLLNVVTRLGTDNTTPAVTPPPFIDCMGDSVTLLLYNGTQSYTTRLPLINGITVNAIAEGGNTVYSPGGQGNPAGNFQYYRLGALNKGYSGQYITICYGINDMAANMCNDAWEATFKGYIQDFIAAGFPIDKIILIIPPISTNFWGNALQMRIREARIAAELGIIKLDMFQIFKDTGINNELFMDIYHPNATGHTLWAQKLDSLIKR